VRGTVLVTDAPVVSLSWVEEFNKAALAAQIPWTSGALLQRSTVHIGPSVIPSQTACWKCFEFRFKSNLGSVTRYEEFQAYVEEMNSYLDHGNLPVITEFTGALVAFEALRTAGTLLTIDLWDMSMDTHAVLKLPRCPHCSSVSSVPQERVWS
jgi:bacteriocin biosynthesis cyclodehydratase domain-containing protein